MSELCLLAASLLSQGQIPGWQITTPPQPANPVSGLALAVENLAVTQVRQNCQTVDVKGMISSAEMQRPEFSSRQRMQFRSEQQAQPQSVIEVANHRPQRSVSAAIAPNLPRSISRAMARLPLPEIDSTGQPYLPYATLTTPRPATGSQLYQQRVVALRAGRVYTRMPGSSYMNAWSRALAQPTYQQWVSLLSAEAGAIARGQGSNRLTVMVGDSLCLWYPQERLSSDRFWLNQGISGDTTAGVLQRLSAFAQTRPDQIHVMAGINDLRRGATDAQVLNNLQQIIHELRNHHPHARIFVQSILPTRLAAIPASRIRAINDRLSQITQREGVSFVDLQSYFADASGNLRNDLTTDGLHLNSNGYATWQMALQTVNPTL
jgi:lysophospholipase L1-like esterase